MALGPGQYEITELGPSSGASHRCVLSQEKKRWRNVMLRWWLPVTHFILTMTAAGLMIFFINGKKFRVDRAPAWEVIQPSTWMTQSDLVTVISAYLTITNLVAGAWQALSAWRCLFVLLETTGLTLSEITNSGSSKLPRFASVMFGGQAQRSNVAWVIFFILLLAWPSRLANSLVTGSIDWTPTYDVGTQAIQATAPLAYANNGWSWYISYHNDRLATMQSAASMASLGVTHLNNGTDPSLSTGTPARRMLPNLGQHTAGSIVEDLVVPVLDISSFAWVTEITDIPTSILASITTPGYLNITDTTDIPIQQNHIAGTTALLKGTPWRSSDWNTSQLPPTPATVPTFTKYAALYVSRNQPGVACQAGPSDPTNASLYSVRNWNNYTDCYAIARLGLSAGVAICSNSSTNNSPNLCRLSQNSTSIVELVSDRLILQPDSLCDQVFEIMPTVQALKAALADKLYHYVEFPGHWEHYVRESLVSSYQGSWSSLTILASTGDRPSNLSISVRESWQALRADVNHWRIYVYLVLNLLLPLSALMLLCVKVSGKGKTVADPMLTAMLLDTTRVLDDDHNGLCNTACLEKQKQYTDMRVKLKVWSRDDKDHYHHPMLVPQFKEVKLVRPRFGSPYSSQYTPLVDIDHTTTRI